MPASQLETLDDILDAWQKTERESDKRALWRALACGGWLRETIFLSPAPYT